MMRIEVDPNSISRRNPAWSVADLPDPAPAVGDLVRAVQPDDGGMVLTHLATVVNVNTEYGLLYLEVDWSRSTYGVDVDKILAGIPPHFDDPGDQRWESFNLPSAASWEKWREAGIV